MGEPKAVCAAVFHPGIRVTLFAEFKTRLNCPGNSAASCATYGHCATSENARYTVCDISDIEFVVAVCVSFVIAGWRRSASENTGNSKCYICYVIRTVIICVTRIVATIQTSRRLEAHR